MINLDNMKQLLQAGDEHTLSIYLDVDRSKQENQSAQPAWRIFLKDAINEAESQAKKHESWRKLKQRFDNFFDDYDPQVKGLAVFFTPDDEQVYELPVPVTSRWHYGKPLIAPLLWAIDEYEPYLIVRVDREKAEIITAYLGNITVEDKLESDLYLYDFEQKTIMPAIALSTAGSNPVTTGSNRDVFQNTINEHIAQFHREVVDHIETQVNQHPHIRIIISGEEQSAHAVRNLLPQRLTESVVEVKPIPMYLNERQVFDQVLPDALNYEREQEIALVQQVIDFAKAGGRGALGRKDVELALQMQRVETLLLPWPTDNAVEATELSAQVFESGGKVELVHDAAAYLLEQEGGIAARLYYAIEPT